MFEPFWRANDKIVIGVSGGIDSMALANMVLKHADKEQLIIAHVNHFMRENATRDQQFVMNWAKDNNLTIETNTTAPPIVNEEQARHFRYQFFKSVVDKYNANYLLTAHHKDDDAETIIMSLIRTGNANTLLGIAYKQPFYKQCELVRPLLHVTKKDIEHYVQQYNIQYVVDGTNESDCYTRNRLRHHVMPYITQENTQAINHIVTFSRDVYALNEFVDNYVEMIFNQCINDNRMNIERLLQEKTIIQKKVLAKWLYMNDCLTLNNVNQLQQTLKNNNGFKQFNLGNNKMCIKSYTMLDIVNGIQQTPKFVTMTINANEKISVQSDNERWHISVCENYNDVGSHIVIPIIAEDLPLSIRPQLAGDTIAIKNGHKKIARVFIDKKIPKNKRTLIPLIVTKNGEVKTILKSGLEYLSKYVETGKITHVNNYYLVAEREKNNDS